MHNGSMNEKLKDDYWLSNSIIDEICQYFNSIYEKFLAHFIYSEYVNQKMQTKP